MQHPAASALRQRCPFSILPFYPLGQARQRAAIAPSFVLSKRMRVACPTVFDLSLSLCRSVPSASRKNDLSTQLSRTRKHSRVVSPQLRRSPKLRNSFSQAALSSDSASWAACGSDEMELASSVAALKLIDHALSDDTEASVTRSSLQLHTLTQPLHCTPCSDSNIVEASIAVRTVALAGARSLASEPVVL